MLNSPVVDVPSRNLLGFAPPKVTLKKGEIVESYESRDLVHLTEIQMDINFWC